MSELPRRALARSARLAALPLGYAGRSAVGMGRRLGGSSPEAVMTDLQQRTAEQLFRTLGDLKGGAMKMGQALSILESALPEDVAAPYREQLTKLQDSAPPMAARTVHNVLASELGTRWRSRLVELDDVPGRLRLDRPGAPRPLGGRPRGRGEGAVPRRRGRADVRPAAAQPASPAPSAAWCPGIDIKPLIAELQARVAEELDYRLEAEAQHAFAVEFRDDPEFRVPDVVAHTQSVLVSEWVDSSASLARLISTGTKQERDHYGELYVRFLFAGPARVGMLHADPHPGNFRLLPTQDGSPRRPRGRGLRRRRSAAREEPARTASAR